MSAYRPKAPKKTAPKNRLTEISRARKAAFDVLMAVERGHSHSDDLLRGKAIDALSEADRHLATALVLGVLRWQIRLDHQLQALLARPNAKLDTEIRVALRLAAFQLLHMDRIPARAAIDESVELAKQAGHRFASGMVNAVLRKLPKETVATSTEENAGALAMDCAHPAWMVERWASNFGLDAARSICSHNQAQPAVSIRIAGPEVEAELVDAGIVLEAGGILMAARVVVSGDVTATVAFKEGRVRLQDEGSQLVAELAAGNLDQNEQRILDACAAPGGKTLILAERNPQARIVACEASAPRLEALRSRLKPHEARIECRLADAATLDQTDAASFDLAMADVPCSGTGTLGRNPEIRHRLRLEDLARQAERQRAILQAALCCVRPGGRVVYSTCSLEPEENEDVVAAALAENLGAQMVPMKARIEELLRAGVLTASGAEKLKGACTAEGALRLLPGEFRTDGFFVALLEKTA